MHSSVDARLWGVACLHVRIALCMVTVLSDEQIKATAQLHSVWFICAARPTYRILDKFVEPYLPDVSFDKNGNCFRAQENVRFMWTRITWISSTKGRNAQFPRDHTCKKKIRNGQFSLKLPLGERVGLPEAFSKYWSYEETWGRIELQGLLMVDLLVS